MSTDHAGALQHVEINVSDLDRSRDFWGWFLERIGYHKKRISDSGFSYELGATCLVFAKTESTKSDQAYERGGTGLSHLAFYASSSLQVDAITDQLRQRETKHWHERGTQSAGPKQYSVCFEDPDGIKVELIYGGDGPS